jgi:hypothetical protein
MFIVALATLRSFQERNLFGRFRSCSFDFSPLAVGYKYCVANGSKLRKVIAIVSNRQH